jgi:capsular exopolysaccharide synthesis family protein
VEAYRALRTNIRFSSPDRPVKTLMVTSPLASEGKTTTAANLGAVFARAGATTIIVDADLRKPRQHKIFQVDNRAGLTTALVSDVPSQMNGNLKESGVPNLRLLASGPRPPNPSELLSSERMNALMEHLRGEADVVIFDTPPCLAVSDPAVLASRVDGVLLVLQAGKSRREAAVRAKEALEQVGAKILGVVLTKIPARKGRYGYYYYYYPSYYSDEDKPGKKKRRRSSPNS